MRTVVSVLGGLLLVAYPVAVYYGLPHLSTRQVALLLFGVLSLGVLLRMPRERAQALWPILRMPLAVGALLSLTLVLDDHRFLLATPVLINAVLLAGFFGSLLGPTPIVERFARLQVDDLSPSEVLYCRQVTAIWSAFFVLNGGTAAALALFAPLSWWTLYTGLISYVLMGLLATVEYVVRKARFGRFGDGFHDRLLRALLGKAAPHA